MSEGSGIVRPSEVRICRACTNLVTAEKACPYCGKETIPHPESGMKEDYCIGCAEGPFPADDLHVVVWEQDPYRQDEEGGLWTLCKACHTSEEEEF